MLLAGLFENSTMVIIYLLAIGLAIGIHEAAHATVAAHFGDDTAKRLGRTSINPLVHLDPIGTLLFVIAGFGWGKPVPVNEGRLGHKNQVILVALAGPASNFAGAVILALLARLLPSPALLPVLTVFIVINLSLMLFNLIPIPPLDGSKVLRLFVPDQVYFLLEQYGFLLILALFFLLRGALATWLVRGIDTLFQLLVGSPLGL